MWEVPKNIPNDVSVSSTHQAQISKVQDSNLLVLKILRFFHLHTFGALFCAVCMRRTSVPVLAEDSNRSRKSGQRFECLMCVMLWCAWCVLRFMCLMGATSVCALFVYIRLYFSAGVFPFELVRQPEYRERALTGRGGPREDLCF